MKSPEPPKEARLCSRCGASLMPPLKVFDINRGKYVQLFRCSCGQLMWDD